GTGKTTLSRKLAYSWAQRAWGKAFEAVYVLPVRALQQSQYNNLSMRRDETLATAIANHCFHPREEDEYKRLRRQISQELEQPTTLLVLDGLDERYGASEKLLGQALVGNHKLLLLSRPYGIEQERSLVDLEIEHVGLSDEQMENYVSGELPPELGEGLLSFIKEHPAIEAVAHVPVNLHILCALWQNDVGGVRAEIMRGSLPGLYRKLTRYIWERYERRHRELCLQNKEREELFDVLGKIALRALERGDLLISPELVGAVLEELPNSGDRQLFRDILPASGLLQVVGRQYQFPHLTFQEYFAGRLLARQLLSSEANVRKFFSEHKYERQYGVMFSFLSGEVSKEQGVEGIRQLLSLLEETPQEVVGVQHLLLQMKLLNEWLCVAGEDLEVGLAALEEEFHVMDSLQDWFREGLERVRRKGDRALLELLTTGLQGSRAVAAPAEQVLPSLIEAMRDKDYDVRSAASEALGEISLQQRIETYWATQKQGLIPIIATQLYHTPLLVRTSLKPHHQQVVLYPTAGQSITWDKPHEEVQRFVQQIKSAQPNSAFRVRDAASYVSREVVKATPEHAEQALPLLTAARKDSY
ncbi:MAG: NACHT domain-containing protein, partial [Cytophagales bacterium]|nr:NACHT domain-containing protein [Cytophagales bacterium]